MWCAKQLLTVLRHFFFFFLSSFFPEKKKVKQKYSGEIYTDQSTTLPHPTPN
jgi:hypothetical protein